MSASDIRQEIDEYRTYLILVCALIESGQKHQEFHDLMSKVTNFVDTASSKNIKSQGKQLLQILKAVIEPSSEFLPRRKSIRQIARDFLELSKQIDVWRFGIPYGWLQERFGPKIVDRYSELPPHARIGIGIHFGSAGVEEVLILNDAYFLLAKAEDAFLRMHTYANSLCNAQEELHSGKSSYEKITAINTDVSTFSRLSVVNAAAFVEAFVNSVGWAESERKPQRSEEVITQLKGITAKGRYLSLESKLEKFPKLIRESDITPFVLSDPKQIKEPFTTFLKETKEIRDASMHYAPGKAQIWRAPHDWYTSAQRSVEYAVRVAESFWLACYPQKNLPSYLGNLNHTTLIEIARERIKRSDSTK